MWLLSKDSQPENVLGIATGPDTRIAWVGNNKILSFGKLDQNALPNAPNNPFSISTTQTVETPAFSKAILWDQDSSIIYNGDSQGNLSAFDTTGKLLKKMALGEMVLTIEKSANNLVSLALGNGQIESWDIRTNQKEPNLRINPPKGTKKICWSLKSPNPNVLLAGYDDGKLMKFDFRATDNPVAEFQAEGGVCSIESINDEFTILSTTKGYLGILENNSFSLKTSMDSIHGPESTIWCVKKAPKGSNGKDRFLTAGMGGDLKLWEMNFEKKMESISTLFVASAGVTTIQSFDSKENIFVMGSLDQNIEAVAVTVK